MASAKTLNARNLESLGASGLARLRDLAIAWQAEPVVTPPDKERKAIGWSGNGAIYADQIDTSHRKHASAQLLKDVADASGDVDGWIAQYDAKARRVPAIAARIAERLLGAGRAGEAWAAFEASEVGRGGWVPPEWDQARLAVLEALGRVEDAQAFRWERFAATLDTGHLRAFIQRLPDFEDFDAEHRALAHARAFPDVHRALAFLAAWPALDHAASLVVERADAIDGDLYELLTPAAEALDEKYPLAATILRRAMIGFTLTKARSSRYRHAARHLAECSNLARRIGDYGTLPDHERYIATLRASHGRKSVSGARSMMDDAAFLSAGSRNAIAKTVWEQSVSSFAPSPKLQVRTHLVFLYQRHIPEGRKVGDDSKFTKSSCRGKPTCPVV